MLNEEWRVMEKGVQNLWTNGDELGNWARPVLLKIVLLWRAPPFQRYACFPRAWRGISYRRVLGPISEEKSRGGRERPSAWCASQNGPPHLIFRLAYSEHCYYAMHIFLQKDFEPVGAWCYTKLKIGNNIYYKKEQMHNSLTMT